MPTDPISARRRAAERRLQRDAAETDLEVLDQLLADAHGFRSAILAAAPHLHVARARDALEPFADLFDDLLGDTLGAARQRADDALDDAREPARAGRAA